MSTINWESLLSNYRFRILAIEDSILFQHELQAALGTDCELTILASAEEGEAWLFKHVRDPPDLVLLDVVLPGIDGITLLERIRANKLFNDLQVIIMTELSEIDKKRRAF